MTNATLTRAPTAHVTPSLRADYVAVSGDTATVATAHVTATLSTTEPGD